MSEHLSSLFAPRTVAVIGASPRPGSVGGEILRNIIRCGYRGKVYPVNPKYTEINGILCYRSVDALPVTVDVAIIAVKRELVPGIVKDCGKAKVKNAVVITAGFKESDEEGKRLEDELRNIAKRYEINLIGPNCMGIINSSPSVSLNASFSRFFPKSGDIAFISQSGSLGETFLEFFDRMGIGLSMFINLGNRAGLTENDILVALSDTPEVRTIFFYLESFADPQALRSIAENIGQNKRLLVFKAGRTKAGAAAAASHTGALASSDSIVDAFLKQSGIIRVSSLNEAFIALRAFTTPIFPKGRRIMILTNAGGAGIVAADASERSGLEIPNFSSKTCKKLASFLPPEASIDNPVDMLATATASDYERALRTSLGEVDAALIIFRPPVVLTDPAEEVADGILRVHSKTAKPIVACTLSESEIVKPFQQTLTRAGVPVYTMPEDAVEALRFLYQAGKTHTDSKTDHFKPDQAQAARTIEQAKSAGRQILSFAQGADILRAYGIPIPPYTYVEKGNINKFIREIGFPLVAKIDAPNLLHRFEKGAVITDITDRSALRNAIDTLRKVMTRERLNGRILLQPMLAGRELIIGMKQDPSFGPVLIFGIGGTLVEALQDISFGVAPISPGQAEEMIRAIRAFPLLGNFRGQPAVDIQSLALFIHRLGTLSLDFPWIEEIDLNPFIAGKTAAAVDILIKLK